MGHAYFKVMEHIQKVNLVNSTSWEWVLLVSWSCSWETRVCWRYVDKDVSLKVTATFMHKLSEMLSTTDTFTDVLCLLAASQSNKVASGHDSSQPIKITFKAMIKLVTNLPKICIWSVREKLQTFMEDIKVDINKWWDCLWS